MTTARDLQHAFAEHQQGRGLSKNTVRRRTTSLNSFRAYIAPLTFKQATSDLVEEWLRQLPSPATRHAYRADLNAFYSWAKRRKLLSTNPITDTDGIRVPRHLPRPVPAEYLPAILAGAPSDVRLMVALAAYAGLRVAEIANLDREDIALHTLPPMLAVRDGKGHKDRIIPIHPELATMLAYLPPGRVVPLSSHRISVKVSEHLHALGIDATAHKLRHLFATELARATDGNVILVARLLGHESIQTSMAYIGWAGGDSAPAVTRMFPHCLQQPSQHGLPPPVAA